MQTDIVENKNIKEKKTLRHRALNAGSWTIGGHISSQVLRLGGNLILTRLLFPEAFGLMAIVQSVIVGLAMFSDLGIEASIIHNKRGHEHAFINTAWTMQIIQSVFIWLGLCLIAPFAAAFYAQPTLAILMPVVGLGSVIGGLASTKLALVNRSLVIKKLVFIEVGAHASGLLVMVLWAWVDRSIWSLVGGGLFTALVKTAASHLVIEGERNKFAWDREAVKELFGFGQWVLVSSMLTFLGGEGNKLLIGAFLGVKLLAFFTLASAMSTMFWTIAQQVSNKVLFPAYSEVVRERPERLRVVATKSRFYLIVPGWLISLFFVLWGDHFMSILYDHRYTESGYMLQMLAMGMLVGTIGASYGGLLWAKGLVRLSTVLLVAQIAIQVLGMILGNYFLGARGVVLSVALLSWLLYPAQAYVYAKIDLWEPKLDFPFIALSVIVVVINFTGIFYHV
jgi:O-antigen/teichoic acid export membrane protein